MLFVQHFLVINFAFCTSSQDLFFWSKYEVLVQFEGLLGFDSWFFCFLLGYFRCVYVCVCVCGYVCIQWRANWKPVLFILLLTPVEIKQVFTFVTFYFF